MTELQMQAVVTQLRGFKLSTYQTMTRIMQATHASDHVTPTHTVRSEAAAARPKSFYMKKFALASDQQGWKEQMVWGKTHTVPNMVMVGGFVACPKEDEATIIYRAFLTETDYMVISADDKHVSKFLYVTAVPAGYAGFSYMTRGEAGRHDRPGESTSLPVEVPYNIVVVRWAGAIHKLLSTYPAGQSYVDGKAGV